MSGSWLKRMLTAWVVGGWLLLLGGSPPWAQADSKPVPRLEAQDSQPLGERMPLVLVHGINPNPKLLYNWSDFLAYAGAQPGFAERYKVYFFIFDPAAPVGDSGIYFRQALQELTAELPADRPVRIVALSLGGLLVRKALDEPGLSERVDRFIAVGVPFHGTPLANPEWIRRQLKQRAWWSPLRLTNRLAYAFTERRFPHFEADYCWDNFDGALPRDLADRCTPTDYGPHQAVVPTITYAAFFDADPQHVAWLRAFLGTEQDQANAERRRNNPLSRHFLFPFVQACMANLPLCSGEEADVPPLMGLNDGISPLSSQLWLGRFLKPVNNVPLSQQGQWVVLREELQGSGRARLFEGLDHRDWLEGKTRYAGRNTLKDWLHPNLPPATMFEWLLIDLMRD